MILVEEKIMGFVGNGFVGNGEGCIKILWHTF